MKNGKLRAVEKLSPELYQVNTIEKAYIANEFVNKGHTEFCQHTWHRRFGHRNLDAIKFLANKNLASGIEIKNCGQQIICKCCVKGKMARLPFPKESRNKTNSILDLIHTDVCGPMHTVTPENKRYILSIIDDYSRFSTIYLMSHKNETAKHIKEFIEMTKTQFQKKPKIIRSDRGTEYVNEDLKKYLKQEGIRVQYTAPYSPQQNGVAERKNRSLLEMARCMLLDANLDKKYWGEAINTANYLQNRLPTRATNQTPYKLWFSKMPDVGNLHIFGCSTYVHVHKEQRKKLDDKAKKFIFVGYSDESKAFRLLDTETNHIKISRDVIFLDKASKNNLTHETESKVTFSKIRDNTEDDTEDVHKEESEEESSSEEISEEELTTDEFMSSTEADDDHKEIDQTQFRRSERINRGVPPDRYMASINMVKKENDEPRSAKEALSGPDKNSWKKAMDEEMSSLEENDTW